MSRHGRHGLWTGAVVAALMLGVLAVGVTYAQQQGEQGPPPPGPGRGMGHMRGPGMGPMGNLGIPLRQLNLTDEQRQQVRTIVSGHQADFKALADRAIPAHQALRAAIAGGDEATIRQRSADLGAVQADRAVLEARVRAEILKVLTPEQQKKAQDLFQQFGQRRQGRRPPAF